MEERIGGESTYVVQSRCFKKYASCLAVNEALLPEQDVSLRLNRSRPENLNIFPEEYSTRKAPFHIFQGLTSKELLYHHVLYRSCRFEQPVFRRRTESSNQYLFEIFPKFKKRGHWKKTTSFTIRIPCVKSAYLPKKYTSSCSKPFFLLWANKAGLPNPRPKPAPPVAPA